MNAESPTVVAGTQNALNNYRRLFFAHVGAVVLTGALVVPLLLGVTAIPSWVSVSYCVIIATVPLSVVLSFFVCGDRDRCAAGSVFVSEMQSS